MANPGLQVKFTLTSLRHFFSVGVFAAIGMLQSSALFADGITGAEMLRARMAARPAAMGDAYVALGDDIFSAQINPAGLQALKGVEFSFLHWQAQAGIAYDSFTYAQPFSFGTLGSSFSLRSMPDIDNPLAPDNPVASSDLVFAINYALKIYNVLDFVPELFEEAALGVTLKYISSRLGDRSGKSAAVDLGLRMPLPSEWMLGVALLNFGPAITFIDEGDPLPSTASFGLSRGFSFGAVNKLNVAADLEVGLDGNTRIHFGAEDWVARSLALRLGYVVEEERNLGGPTMGVGLQLAQKDLTLGIDYAFKPLLYQGFSSFEAQHLVSAMLRF